MERSIVMVVIVLQDMRKSRGWASGLAIDGKLGTERKTSNVIEETERERERRG